MNDCVAAVGTFDGVHLGHKAILDRVKELAKERGMNTRVITFMNHPLSVIKPEKCPLWAVSRPYSISALEREGIDRVSEMNFTPELAALTAREFLSLMRERYGVKVLVMGYDNSFGSDRLASREAYVEAGKDAGVEIQFVEAVKTKDGVEVSSSELRKAVEEGEMTEYCSMVSDFYNLGGTVVRGKRNGHKLGFPTVNIRPDEGIVPLPTGVYVAIAYVEKDDFGLDRDDVWGLLNVGTNPTISDGNPITYEFHAPGVDLGELYGARFDLAVVFKFREEEKFGSLKELKQAIRQDIRFLKEFHRMFDEED